MLQGLPEAAINGAGAARAARDESKIDWDVRRALGVDCLPEQ
jgi:hypothetical protein